MFGAPFQLMDALMAALVAGVLAQAGDRPAWLVAILADRWRPMPVIVAAGLALAVASAVAVVGGVLLAPMLSERAARLFLALALTVQGVAQVWPVRAPERLDRWRIGRAATAFLGLLILFAGDGLQFIVLALAAGTELPWLAGMGATVGALAAIVPAAVLGEAGWTRLPLTAIRRGAAVPLLLAGSWLGLGTLGLI